MADQTCPNGEYYSVTLSQCMNEGAYSSYLHTLRDRFNNGDPEATRFLKNEQNQIGDLDLFRRLSGIQDSFAGTAAGSVVDNFLNGITTNLVKIGVIIVGVLLVALAVNAWLNESGGGVKVPVKLK